MKNRYFIFGALFSGIIFSHGCGGDNSTAPSGSTITINPSTVTQADKGTIATTHSQYFTIAVTDSAGKALSNTKISIFFQGAVPDPAGYAQLYDGSTQTDSPFTATTDNYGIYYLRLDYKSGGGLAYTKNLEVRSGTVFATATITVS